MRIAFSIRRKRQNNMRRKCTEVRIVFLQKYTHFQNNEDVHLFVKVKAVLGVFLLTMSPYKKTADPSGSGVTLMLRMSKAIVRLNPFPTKGKKKRSCSYAKPNHERFSSNILRT